MKNSEQAARKKKSATYPNCVQVVIIESTKEGCYSDLAKKVKPNKKKRSVKGMGLEQLDPKKKKKQSNSESKKKICPNPPVIIESNSDSELLRNTRKRLKVFKKKRDQKVSCKQGRDYEATDFHVSKKCNRNVLEVHDEELMMKRKKKKENRKHTPTCSSILHSGDILGKQKANCQEMPVREKKRSRLGQKAVGDGVLVKKKHLDCHMGNQENSNGIPEKGIASSLCKLQDAQRLDGPMQWHKDLTCRSEEGREAIKKKKKKLKNAASSLSSLAKNQENHISVRRKRCLNCPSDKEQGIGKVPKEMNKLTKKKEKKKKKREAGDVRYLSEASQDTMSRARAPGGKEKRKEAKKAEGKQDRLVRNGHERFEGRQEQQVKKKRKNRETGSPQDGDWKASWKKVKTKKEPKETEEEIKLVSFKKGNCDEVNIDKVRRQALQEEIDRESGKSKTIKEEPDNRLGQWGTATFETLQQKATFLRLLGGLKKGLASTQRPPANAAKPNMALDRSKEQKLQHNLQAEFKKAVAFNHHRGTGLGFQPTTPDRVHIDKYASKSIKFED